MHLSPGGDQGSMDVEDSQGPLEHVQKENEMDVNLEETDVNMDKEETKAMEEDISQDGSTSMNLDEQSRDRVVNATEEETRMNFQSDGGDDDNVMDQDMQFVHVNSSKDKDRCDTMSLENVSQNGDESMEVSVIQDEDPFSGTNENERREKQPNGEEAMDVEENIDVENMSPTIVEEREKGASPEKAEQRKEEEGEEERSDEKEASNTVEETFAPAEKARASAEDTVTPTEESVISTEVTPAPAEESRALADEAASTTELPPSTDAKETEDTIAAVDENSVDKEMAASAEKEDYSTVKEKDSGEKEEDSATASPEKKDSATVSPEKEKDSATASPEKEKDSTTASPEKEKDSATASPEEKDSATASPEKEKDSGTASPEEKDSVEKRNDSVDVEMTEPEAPEMNSSTVADAETNKEPVTEATTPDAEEKSDETKNGGDNVVPPLITETSVNIIRTEPDEEICIIPDTVPRVLCNQDGTVRMDGIMDGSMRGSKAIHNINKDWRGKTEVFGRRKSKSIEDISEQIWEKTVAAEALKDGIKKAPPRPQRQAAKKAETQIKEMVEEESNSNESGEIPLKPNEVVEVEGTLQMCIQCYRVRTCKFQLYLSGKARYLCAEECYTLYQKDVSSRAEKTAINDGTEFGRSFARKCAECRSTVTGDECNLSWETMDFCNESCLGKYQAQLGSHCANCKGAVQQLSLGKYCVRFGYDVKQFCCSSCLEEFKKGLKVCSYCQKDISSGTEGFLAPVGDKGQFKDFCTQACMEKYDQMSNNQPPPPVVHQCAVCNNEKVVKVEVIHNNVLNKLCSEPCFAAFKFVNAVVADQCDMCKKYFDKSKMENFTVFYDDIPHSFCCKTCMNVYILANRKIVPCNWCKVKKYNFDMIKQVTSGGQFFMMCSLNCLALYKVSVSAVSPKRIKCDMCQYVNQAQYHLTMSDATIRNFCTYQCVMQFQAQFSKTTPLTMAGAETAPIPTGGPKRTYHRRTSQVNQNENQVVSKGSNLPVISSVQSLAGQQAAPPNNAVTTNNRATVLKANNSNVNIQSKGTQVVYKQQLIVQPPPAKVMRNKSVLCRPYTHTKGVSCRPHPCAKETQTDDNLGGKPVLIPVPVPIFVPAPMHMYSTAFPVPVPFPLPVPVPLFIPTTRNSAKGIMKEIKRIQEKIPTDPFEAELLMMAEMVAGEKKAEESDSESDDAGNDAADVSEVPEASSAAEGGFSPEAVDTSNTFGEDMLQMALKMASELDEPAVDLEAALTPSTITAQSQSSMEQNDATESEDDPEPVAAIPESRTAVRRKRSARRTRSMSGSTPSKRGRRHSSSGDVPLMPPPEAAHIARIEQEKPDANMCLKYTFGVNAWKQWVMTKNAELEKAASNNRKLKLFKPEILQLTADELNYSLCLFVKEVRKPNGSEYAPDTIYYLCLGIQQYLFENGRIDNIFTDSYYEKFTECLDEVAKRFAVLYNDSQYIVTRVEEEHLWECKQLGAHSPHVLLSTLMFFNTKHFNLVTVEEHMQLSFSHIMKHWKRNPNQPGVTKIPGSSRNVLLRFYPPQSALDNNSRKKKVYEQQENEENPLRCPVKLYEFYLSKCPESVKTRNDVFYLLPERSCVPDSPVWYSTQALGRESLMKMLNRVKMVKEINMALLAS
ncbi:zinc finger MYM-type protein 3 [Anabrus simplex]|uniref:zinc finger MYM-type protein 3 n=1 Tax=Anabrus simplex TaxID=316456 RepID=UPI0035A2F498